jgi:hypothetical protein
MGTGNLIRGATLAALRAWDQTERIEAEDYSIETQLSLLIIDSANWMNTVLDR